jgi:hypothetical protein
MSDTGGGTGSVPGTELPAATGAPVTYELSFRWTLLVWRGPNSVPVGTALQTTAPANGQSAGGSEVTAIYGWDPATNAWWAYFTGPPVPGANNLTVLTRGGVYWVAVSGPGTLTWSTTDG